MFDKFISDYIKKGTSAQETIQEKLGGAQEAGQGIEGVRKKYGVKFKDGGKIEAKRVYLTDPAKPYKILQDGKPIYAFKTKNERDIIFEDLKNSGERQINFKDDVDVNDPSNFVWSIVIDTNGMNKTPSKGYRYGGLVQAKREFFAPLI